MLFWRQLIFHLFTATHNGLPRSHDDMTVAEIKSKAKEAVQKVTRGVSAISLINSARQQLRDAKQSEDVGDLKGALSQLHKAAALSMLFMDSAEVKSEDRGKRGVLLKEFSDYEKVCSCLEQSRRTLKDRQREGHDLHLRIDKLERKLLDVEKISQYVLFRLHLL
jgi:hypothetical protein